MLRFVLGSILTLVLACAAGAEAPVYWSHRPFRTVAYGGRLNPPAGFDRAEPPADVVAVIRRTAFDELVQRGYHPALPGETPDLLLYAGVGRRTTIMPRAPFVPELDEATIDEGALVFEAFDAETSTIVWQGTVRGLLDGRPHDHKIARAVREAFRGLPRAGPAPATAER
jgi:hypothetical protein